MTWRADREYWLERWRRMAVTAGEYAHRERARMYAQEIEWELKLAEREN